MLFRLQTISDLVFVRYLTGYGPNPRHISHGVVEIWGLVLKDASSSLKPRVLFRGAPWERQKDSGELLKVLVRYPLSQTT